MVGKGKSPYRWREHGAKVQRQERVGERKDQRGWFRPTDIDR